MSNQLLSPKERIAKYRAKKKKNGYKSVTVMLNSEAYSKIKQYTLLNKDENYSKVINMLINKYLKFRNEYYEQQIEMLEYINKLEKNIEKKLKRREKLTKEEIQRITNTSKFWKKLAFFQAFPFLIFFNKSF